MIQVDKNQEDDYHFHKINVVLRTVSGQVRATEGWHGTPSPERTQLRSTLSVCTSTASTFLSLNPLWKAGGSSRLMMRGHTSRSTARQKKFTSSSMMRGRSGSRLASLCLRKTGARLTKLRHRFVTTLNELLRWLMTIVTSRRNDAASSITCTRRASW